MRTTSLTDLRKSLAAAIDGVAEDREPLLITRGGDKPSAVLLSLEDFASYEETMHLLKSPANAKRLVSAIEELEASGGEEKQLME